MTAIHRKLLVPIAFLASLAGCDPNEPSTDCINPGSTPTADTVMQASFGGRKVLFSSTDADDFLLDTNSHYLDIIVLRHAPDGTQWIKFGVPEFTGPGNFQIEDRVDTNLVPYAIYACQQTPYWSEEFLPDTEYMMQYRSAGIVGNTLSVTSFDPVTGEIEGTFRFSGAPDDGGPLVVLTNGHFRGITTRYGNSAPPPLAPRLQ